MGSSSFKNRCSPAEKALTKGLGGGTIFWCNTLIPPFLSVERNVSYTKNEAYR